MSSNPQSASAFALTAKRPSTFRNAAGTFIYKKSADKYYNETTGITYDPVANRYTDKSGRVVASPLPVSTPCTPKVPSSGLATPPSSATRSSHSASLRRSSTLNSSERHQPALVTSASHTSRTNYGAPSGDSSTSIPSESHRQLPAIPHSSKPTVTPTGIHRRATVGSGSSTRDLTRILTDVKPTAPSKLSQLISGGNTPISATNPYPNPQAGRSFQHQRCVQLRKADYKPGMLFSAPLHTEDWHANAQPNYNTTVSEAFGPVFTKFRMMVVIAKYESHYISLPIYTHGGRGIDRKDAKWEYVSIRDPRQKRSFPDPGPNPPITAMNMLTASTVIAAASFVHLPYVVSRIYELHVQPEGELGEKALVQLIALHNRFTPDITTPFPGQLDMRVESHGPSSLEEAVQQAEIASLQATKKIEDAIAERDKLVLHSGVWRTANDKLTEEMKGALIASEAHVKALQAYFRRAPGAKRDQEHLEEPLYSPTEYSKRRPSVKHMMTIAEGTETEDESSDSKPSNRRQRARRASLTNSNGRYVPGADLR